MLKHRQIFSFTEAKGVFHLAACQGVISSSPPPVARTSLETVETLYDSLG